MFSSIGWPEIFAVLIIGMIVIGPERLPRIIEDVRAAIFAARKAINQAKAELNGEFGEEFDELRKPLNQIAQIQRMGPRGMIAKALFDGDEEFMDSFNPDKLMQGDTAGKAHRQGETAETIQVERPAGFNYAEIYRPKESSQTNNPETNEGNSGQFEDIT